MKRLPFRRRTNYYDERLFQTDEKICTLLNQRKEISNQNPGVPPDDAISEWSSEYGFYEEYLLSLFSSMAKEQLFKPRIEPTKYRKHFPIFKTFENQEVIYTVPFIRQYSNASVIYLYVDWDETNDILNQNERRRSYFELSIDETYDCRSEGGGGSTGNMGYKFIVSPPLPDNPAGIKLFFKETNLNEEIDNCLEFSIELG